MKTTSSIKRNRFLVLLAVFGFLAAFAIWTMEAVADLDSSGSMDMKADLQGFEEVPAISTTGFGELRLKVSNDETSIDFELSYSDLEAPVRQAHIHLGQFGVNGGISVFLCQTAGFPDPTGLAPVCPQSGVVTGTLTSANVIGPTSQGIAAGEFAELLAAIRAGATYANVHSNSFPGGEIRGQIK